MTQNDPKNWRQIPYWYGIGASVTHMYPVRLVHTSIIGRAEEFQNNIISARNKTLIRRLTQWEASDTSNWRRKEEAQIIDTWKCEAVQSSKIAEAQRSMNSSFSTHHLEPWVSVTWHSDPWGGISHLGYITPSKCYLTCYKETGRWRQVYNML